MAMKIENALRGEDLAYREGKVWVQKIYSKPWSKQHIIKRRLKAIETRLIMVSRWK
ncbi:Hypothetical protein FKW44_015942 [Caligus rogercresseyi]|uniref:Uncharacterized protein n=1 Tax=Caligus rogercresseyi TaxID=217165 RepID=A0A7T8H1Q1_CALRO|nr:Hypothetical protein FKW44_015942 [Caligus rogercresseyi]